MSIITVNVSDITVKPGDKPQAGNWPPDSEPFTALKKSVERNGLLIPVFIDHENMIVQGHYRFEAARQLGLKTVPAIMVRRGGEIEAYFKNPVRP